MAVPKSVEKRIERIENMLRQERGAVAWVIFEGDREPDTDQVQDKDILIKFSFKR